MLVTASSWEWCGWKLTSNSIPKRRCCQRHPPNKVIEKSMKISEDFTYWKVFYRIWRDFIRLEHLWGKLKLLTGRLEIVLAVFTYVWGRYLTSRWFLWACSWHESIWSYLKMFEDLWRCVKVLCMEWHVVTFDGIPWNPTPLPRKVFHNIWWYFITSKHSIRFHSTSWYLNVFEEIGTVTEHCDLLPPWATSRLAKGRSQHRPCWPRVAFWTRILTWIPKQRCVCFV